MAAASRRRAPRSIELFVSPEYLALDGATIDRFGTLPPERFTSALTAPRIIAPPERVCR